MAAGFGGAALPLFVHRELEGYLDCGMLCRGLARLKCESCTEQHLVAFACKARGICPSCLGRKMCQTALNLTEHDRCVERHIDVRKLPYRFIGERYWSQIGVVQSCLRRVEGERYLSLPRTDRCIRGQPNLEPHGRANGPQARERCARYRWAGGIEDLDCLAALNRWIRADRQDARGRHPISARTEGARTQEFGRSLITLG